MPHNKLHVVSYVRDMSLKTGKFDEFNRMLQQVKDADAVLISSPEVLGDDYNELTENLNKLAEAKLGVVIVPKSERERMMAKRN